MPLSTQIKNQHLLWRAGFGFVANETLQTGLLNSAELYANLEKNSDSTPVYIDRADKMIKGLLAGKKNEFEVKENGGLQNPFSDKQKKNIRRQSVKNLKNLNLAWLDEMINSKAQLREKMSLFWHGHFACRNINIHYQQLLLHEIRSNALGNFGNLLRAVSKSAAMLQFLNNQQNHKQHPNENFAREVMELFTLGRSNYTETDVKEAARSFTGWGFTLNGEFINRQFFHDTQTKIVLGKNGNFNGDDILNILLEQKATAFFITKKIYKYFVNENVDEEKIQWLAERFYQTGYDIKALLKDIFTSEWFYDEKYMGAKIKSPVELIVGIRRMLPMELESPQIQILFQKALGQILFYPPNVAGWPGGNTWIDSSTLMLRLRIPQLIKDGDSFFITPKEDDDQQMGMQENNENATEKYMNGNVLQVKAIVHWDKFITQFNSTPQEDIYAQMEQLLLQTPTGNLNRNIVEEMIHPNTRTEYIKSVAIAMMSTPEYQLC